jgi:hypothetical protein
MTDRPTYPLTERLAALAAFVPNVGREDFSMGEWVEGSTHLPWFFLSDEASRLVNTVNEYGWVVFEFNWMEWAESPEGRRWLNDADLIGGASVEDLERLLTAHIRADRFIEGHLDEFYESGQLLAILRRAETLLRELAG